MVLWRAYKRILHVDFTINFLNPFVEALGNFFQNSEIVHTICSPVIYAADVISNISINLNAVKVTCPGAQSPLFLAADLLIVGVVVIVIESDVQVFWTMMFGPAMSKIRRIVLNKYFFGRNIFSSSLYILLTLLMSQIPEPSKLVQYCMGFVVISDFFDLTASSDWVNYSTNCDGAIRSGSGYFPMDSILANISAVLAICVLPIGIKSDI